MPSGMFFELWMPWMMPMRPEPAPGMRGSAEPTREWQTMQASTPSGFVTSCAAPRQTWRPWQA